VRIAIGCDHRGLDIKRFVTSLASDAGHSVEDFGCYTTESVDYPDIAGRVALAVAGGDFTQGILICNTGIGMSIAANKVKGIRAALCCARQHNDANILCLGTEREPESISEIVKAYLTSEFEGGRHLSRVNKIVAMEG